MLSGDVTRFAMQTDLDDGELRILRHDGGEIIRSVSDNHSQHDLPA